MNTSWQLMLVMLLAFSIGCEVPEIDLPEDTAPTGNVTEQEDTRLDMSEVEGEPPTTTEEPREFQAKDGKKGKLSRQAGGYLGAVASARFTAVNQMTINLYTHALQLYNAEKGHYPKTHEEFMEKIIKYNHIQLPELEEGDEYLYDPEDHTLKIHRPAT